MTAHVDPASLEVLTLFDEEHRAALARRVRELIAQSFSPPPKLTVSEWADAERVLSPEASSEPGKWRTDRVEPSRGIMDAFAEPGVEFVTCMVAAQTVKTEVALNLAGFHVDLDPCPMMILQPTLQMAEAFSKDRLSPMCRDTPALARKIGDAARDSNDTILHKKYRGGHITMAGANSPASLASRPIRVLMCDEVDRYEASAGKEGDPVSLAIERTTTFHNRKIVLLSTPTIKGASRIEAAFEESDQRRFFVPCPHCQHEQHLRWAQVRWPGMDGEGECRPLEAAYFCEDCGSEWNEGERLEAISLGRWIAQKPEIVGRAGFHLNRIASPWRPLGEMANDYELVKKYPERLKTWVNTRLAETWEDKGERVDPEGLLNRVEEYGFDPMPSPVGLVACGVDVQDDRFEIEWLGHGESDETWSLDYIVRYGDPNSPGFWAELDHALLRTFRHPSGIILRAEATCIDSGGHFTTQVYDFCRSRLSRKVFPIKGMGGPGRPLWPAKGTKNAAKAITVFVLGVDQGKDALYKMLAVKEPGPGYCHFPKREPEYEGYRYDRRHFEGLTAEKKVAKTDNRGFVKNEWHKVIPRNEPLDCRIYAMAARHSIGIDMERRMGLLRQAAAVKQQGAPRRGTPGVKPTQEGVPHAGGRRVRHKGVEA